MHNTNKSRKETNYFANAFKKLIVADLWEEIFFVNDDGNYSYTNVWPKQFNFIKN